MTRVRRRPRPALRAALLLPLAAAVPGRPARAEEPDPCPRSLWGCIAAPHREKSESLAAQRTYDRVCSDARSALRTASQYSLSMSFDATLQALEKAAQGFPEQPDAFALHGRLLFQLGRLEEAEPLLLQARALLSRSAQGTAAVPLPDSSLDRADTQLVELDLSYLQALRGDGAGALQRDRRVLQRAPQNPRALWRTGDVLMQQGQLEEAADLYERACFLPRVAPGGQIDQARGCAGLLVALDRSERAPSAATLRRLRSLDAGYRVVLMPDFLPLAERDYYRAVLSPPSCTRVAALRAFVQGAQAAAADAHTLPVAEAFVRRAEAQLRAQEAHACTQPVLAPPPPPPQP